MEPGWHPDPFERRRQRWWDGTTWTAYARSGGEVEWDPEPVEEPAAPIEPGMPGFVTALLGFGVGVGLAYLAPRLLGTDDEDVVAQLVSSAGLWIGLVGACVLVALRRGSGSILRDLAVRIRWIDVGLGFAGSLAARVLVGAAIAPVPLPTRRLRDLGQSTLPEGGLGGWELLVVFVIVCIGAPLFEELFFRGLVQPRLVERFGVGWGIVATSLLFGAAHMIGWAGVFSIANAWAIAASGLVLGYLRHETGRLGAPVMAHFFFNAQVVALLALTS